MTVIKINAITVDAGSGDELAHRFAARAGSVDDQFNAWVESPAFAHGHRSQRERDGGETPKPVGVRSELWNYDIAVTS